MTLTYHEIESRRKEACLRKSHFLFTQRNTEKEKLLEIIRNHNTEVKKCNSTSKKAINIMKENEVRNISALPISSNNNILDKNVILANTSIFTEIIPIVDKKTTITIIPYSEELVTKFKLNNFIEYVGKDNIDLKRTINKRVNQVSSDPEQILLIAEELQKYQNLPFFNIIFIRKVIQQGKVQVSKHLQSYKCYSYLFTQLYDDQLLSDLQIILFTEKSNDNREVRGIFLIYFGVLKAKRLFEEAMFVFECIMKVQPVESTLYVLEALFMVLGKDLYNFFKDDFLRLKVSIDKSWMEAINNEATKARILILLNKCLN